MCKLDAKTSKNIQKASRNNSEYKGFIPRAEKLTFFLLKVNPVNNHLKSRLQGIKKNIISGKSWRKNLVKLHLYLTWSREIIVKYHSIWLIEEMVDWTDFWPWFWIRSDLLTINNSRVDYFHLNNLNLDLLGLFDRFYLFSSCRKKKQMLEIPRCAFRDETSKRIAEWSSVPMILGNLWNKNPKNLKCLGQFGSTWWRKW